jgi:hypothetical protein
MNIDAKDEDYKRKELAALFPYLDEKQVEAVYIFALHLMIGSIPPIFFKQIGDALEGSRGDLCRK